MLVVKDDNPIREVAAISSSITSSQDIESVDVRGGLTAAQLVATDCVLLEVVRPGLSGFEECTALRADPKFQTAPS